MATFGSGCLLCGVELVYEQESADRACAICGRDQQGTATCGRGHYVCDACHGLAANDVIERVCARTNETDPVALALTLMRSPTVSMHGPEHHFLVPAALLACLDNALQRSDRKASDLAEARRRAERVPGGFCGTHGNCGAGVGTGIFWSIATGASPLAHESWSHANEVTARSLLRIAKHGGPRCCKRDTLLGLEEAVDFVAERLPQAGWSCLSARPSCEHTSRNAQCRGQTCPFHPVASASGE